MDILMVVTKLYNLLFQLYQCYICRYCLFFVIILTMHYLYILLFMIAPTLSIEIVLRDVIHCPLLLLLLPLFLWDVAKDY